MKARAVHIAVIGLFVCGAALRFFRLDHYPLPMHQDELANAYDAYSLVETGSDIAGVRMPFVIRARGRVDYRPALYAWLTTVPIRVSGFSPAAARVPSALLGLASLGLLFLFAKSLVDEQFALIAMAFATFNPWHITYSRFAHEGAMLPAFFVILALWLWQRTALRGYRPWELLSLGLVAGLSSSAYQTTRLIAPLLTLLICFDVARFSKRRLAGVAILASGALVGAMPQLYVLITAPEQFFGRFFSAQLTHPDNTQSLPVSIFHTLRYAFNPRLLFWPDMRDSGWVAARFLPIELLFCYLGMATLLRLQPVVLQRFRWYVYVVFAIVIFPALITWASNSMRFAGALLLYPMWTAAGVVWSAQRLSKRGIRLRTTYATVAAGALACCGLLMYLYLAGPATNGSRSNNLYVQVGERLGKLNVPYDRVYVVDSPMYAGLHVAAFSGIRPAEFKRTRKIEEDKAGWDYIRSIGKYHFLKPRELTPTLRESCTSGRRDLFATSTTIPGAAPIDSVYWFSEKYFFTELRNTSACGA